MIRPESRTVVWSGVISFALAAGMALYPGFGLAAAAIVLLFVTCGVLDAVAGSRRMAAIRVRLPETVRMTKGRPAVIMVSLTFGEGLKGASARVNVPLPWEFDVPPDAMTVTALETEIGLGVKWSCTGNRRGEFRVNEVYVEMTSPLGLWGVRVACPVSSQIRVYPDTSRDRRRLAAQFLHRGGVGIHAHRQVGKGKEFERLREYLPGDSYEDVYWKATAKRGRPVTKLFQIERTQEVYVVLDTSRLSARRVREDDGGTISELERFIGAAMVLGQVAERQGDLFGVVAFDEEVRAFVRAKNGPEHYRACRDALYALEPRMVNPDFGEVCAFLRTRFRRRALVVFLTNLDDPVIAEEFVRQVSVVAPHHLILVNMLAIPGVAPVFSDVEVGGVDDVYRRLGGHVQWRQLQEVERTLKRRGVAMHMIASELLGPELVSQYVNVKRRQAL